MPSLILSPRQTEDSQALWREAISRGWEVKRLSNWQIDDDTRELSEPFLYVEALFGPTLAEQLAVQLIDPPEDWLCRLPSKYRKRNVELTTLKNARELKRPAFVKPPNDKSFPAAVYSPASLPTCFEPDMAVLVSEPVAFESEFRCFVLNREVRTYSLYSRNGEPTPQSPWTKAESDSLLQFVTELLSDETIAIPSACVLDCGPIVGQGWAAVELNAAWGAGIYQCNPSKAIDVVRAATIGMPEAG